MGELSFLLFIYYALCRPCVLWIKFSNEEINDKCHVIRVYCSILFLQKLTTPSCHSMQHFTSHMPKCGFPLFGLKCAVLGLKVKMELGAFISNLVEYNIDNKLGFSCNFTFVKTIVLKNIL